MYANKLLVTLMTLVCGIVNAQTIDEISDLNRKTALAEAQAKFTSTFTKTSESKSLDAPFASGVIVPAISPMSPSSTPGIAVLKRNANDRPELMAIYGIGNNLVTELSEGGFEAKYKEGGKTPSGWIVSKIEKRNVDLKKQIGKSKKFATVSLPFGLKADDPIEKQNTNSVSQLFPGMSPPPIPANFPVMR